MCMVIVVDSTSNPNELIALKEPNNVQNAYPTIEQQYRFSSNEWKRLTNLGNSKGFRSLDGCIDCPDCADSGVEWMEINWLDVNKRVMFEYRKSVEDFEGLVNELQRLREEYVHIL